MLCSFLVYSKVIQFYIHDDVVQLLSHVRIFCNLTDCSLPGSSVHAIFQARILEWVATSLSRGFFLIQGLNLRLLN